MNKNFVQLVGAVGHNRKLVRASNWLVLICLLAWIPTGDQASGQIGFSLNDHLPTSADRVAPKNSFCCDNLGTFSVLVGIDGSKQPQDFGANANFGGIGQISFSAPLIEQAGIGFQIGNSTAFSANAVQVFELLGESKDRFQNFTTVGLFQRNNSGFHWGFAYDFLFQESYDSFQLGQWRVGAVLDVGASSEIGVTANLSDRRDQGEFNAQSVELIPIEQLRIHFRRQWQTGVQTTVWVGVADRHSEENAITGTLPAKQNQVLFGADIFAPLNDWMAIYGETNIVMPADTGVVDAFLGIQIAPGGIVRSRSRNTKFRPFLPVAANPSFSVDLNRR